MNPEERLLLIDELIEGSIRDADHLRIEAELIVDASVRREYFRRVQLEWLLQQEFGTSDCERDCEDETLSSVSTASKADQAAHREQSANRSKAISNPIVSLAMFAVAASLIAAVFLLPRSSQQQVASTQLLSTSSPSARGFAILDGQEDAIWQGQSIADGELLPTGPLHLLSGKIHLELFSGVRMVLAGQSQFSVDSPMQVTIDSGIARAEVPEPARGFRIKTGSGDIVDLGTEFSVAVDDSGADVHVIEGEVELHADSGDSAGQTVTIAAGTSRRLAAKTGVTSSELVQPTTIGPEEFQRRRDGRKQERLSRWLAADHILRQTPGLIGHYHLGFDSSGGKQIENLVRHSSDAASDGRIVAANASTDRWGRGDAALDFGRVGSRVRIQVPGEHRGLTLMAWVKIHSLDRWYNSLFLTDGHEDGEPHWQWMNDGRIFFSIKVPGPTPSHDGIQPVYYTPPIWTPSLSGRWVMLAVTYDIENQLVTHYLDGQAIDRDEIKQEDIVDAIRIGSASVGNWSQPLYRGDAEFVLRNLNGSMDQFSIASRPLTEDEILSFFEAGNPNE